MSWLTSVRNALPFVAQAARRPTISGTSARAAGRWCSPRSWRRISTSARTASITSGSARRCASTQMFDDGSYDAARRAARCPRTRSSSATRSAIPTASRPRAPRPASSDALINARGTIDGRTAVVGVQDFAFMGGSMGLAVGAAFVARRRGGDRATSAPYIIFTAAGGARMQEGILSPDADAAQRPSRSQMLHDAGLPYIVVLTDPTTGGVTASYAMLGDVQIAEPGALIGFAGQRVIEETIREKLPEGFQRAEYLLDHGMLDMVVHRKDLRERRWRG